VTAAGPRPDAWLDQASLCATLVVVGLPAWLSHWRPAATADERQALSRRLYLFGSLLVAVLTLLASAASVLQRALSEVMGAGAGVPTLSFTQSIAMGLVSAAVLAYHWRILAADNVGRRTDEPAEQAAVQQADEPRLVIEITGANERDIRRALALLPYGASYDIRPAAAPS